MSLDPISREEFLAHVQPIQDDVRRIVSLLEKQSSEVSTIDKRVAILEDRQPTRQAAQWGGASGGAVAVVISILNYLLTFRN
jgi:ABC-type transporter Mla maintaining outer membrane lipid asymmetry ATPase subunit MlaF